jgi:phosphoribosylaminoimidazolecarboxamide formyltransferase/IMP cyclohydrolase
MLSPRPGLARVGHHRGPGALTSAADRLGIRDALADRARRAPVQLRYGMNPQQTPASVEPLGPEPFAILHGRPSYLNLLDAVAGWQLVRELAADGTVAAASFKHVSPAGAALAGPLDAVTADLFGVDAGADAVTRAYARARDTDPRSSYGDMVAVSAPVTAELADLLRRVVSDGIVAPGYEPGAVGVLAAKKRGAFLVLQADPAFEPPPEEVREVYGLRLVQRRDDAALPGGLRDGATLGVAAGQQSRVDCIRLAGAKAELWHRRRFVAPPGGAGSVQDRVNAHMRLAEATDPPVSLHGVSLASDGALPFADNVTEAARFGVRHIAEPGGSTRSPEVVAAAAGHGIAVTRTGLRLFRH